VLLSIKRKGRNQSSGER